jgi:hypothetical protein
MFPARRLSSADVVNGWTEDELARFDAYMATQDARRL